MEMQLRINEYWSKRSDEFADARYQDLHSQKKEEWLSVIRSWLPDKKEIRALDLGTGAGFFAFLMQELGCTVTGIDYSEAMIDNAKKVMGKLGREGIVFRQMDAQKLDFEAESFDFIFSRNVTWTLPDPEQAYREMYRVLAPGGCILNFDANYGQAFKKQDLEGITEKQAVSDTSGYENPARSLAMLKERNQIAAELGICDEKRPFWDVQVLASLGMKKITVDLAAETHFFGGKPVSEAEKAWYNPAALFMVAAQKETHSLKK